MSYCKKLFTCDAKAYNPLEFKTIKICIKEAIVNKIRAKPEYLECNCELDYSEINFFHKANCKGNLFFGELNNKKTVICDKCDSIGFYDGYIWTCPLCLKKTKNIIEKNDKNKNNLLENKSVLHSKNKDKLIDNEKDNFSMNKIPIRKKYKMLNEYNMTDNLSTNNIQNKHINFNDIKDESNENKFKIKHKFSFSKKNSNEIKKENDLNVDNNKDNNNENNKDNNKDINNNYFNNNIRKYLSVLDMDNTYIKKVKNNLDINLDLKNPVFNIPSRNNFQFNLKPNLTSNEKVINNNIKEKEENIKSKDSFITQFNKYKINSKLSRIDSGKNIENNNFNKTQYEKEINRHNKIFYRYKNLDNGINNDKISRNNKLNLDINLSKDFKTEINNNKMNLNLEKYIDQNLDHDYNNKKGSNSTADNSDNTTKIIYYVKNPKQSFQMKKNKNTINLENYKIIKKIGQGSFGQIFEVEDNFKNKFALKKIILTQESDIKKIEHEYQTLIDLNSLKKNLNLNLIKIYGFSSKQLDPTTYVIYVLMELALTDWEKEILHLQKIKSYYPEKNLMKILSSLVKTFSQLQKNNISHRDIKPQNILIFPNKIYKLADFGEAKELYKDLEATNKQTLRGTELYMAPILFQALRSKKLIKYIKHNTYKSDVFSFGLCALFAASLCFESVYDVREAKNNVSIRFFLEKYLGKIYSYDTINIITQMLDINETTRKDFIELEQEFAKIGYD